MRISALHISFLAFGAGMLVTGFTSCSDGGNAGESGAQQHESVDNDWGIDPCRCYEESVTASEIELCREAKHDPNFLSALKACSDKGITPTSAIANAPLDGEYHFDKKTSMIHWTGRKMTGEHSGSMKIRSGVFIMDGGKITGGEVVVEMGTLQCTDLKGEKKTDLESHLRADDFFGVKAHPTATFTVSSSKLAANGGVEVAGVLTVKGEQQPATASIHFAAGDAVVTTVKMSFDRTAFGIRYGSGTFFDDLGDRAINDQVELKMLLVEKFENRKGL
jgi:polyisoprenoid-binding protein YceI